jgi:hypothetical protein
VLTQVSDTDVATGAALSPWLTLMLAEIRRKREELEQARAEQLRRAGEAERSLHNPSDRDAGV